jgi:hypothetical protein
MEVNLAEYGLVGAFDTICMMKGEQLAIIIDFSDSLEDKKLDTLLIASNSL